MLGIILLLIGIIIAIIFFINCKIQKKNDEAVAWFAAVTGWFVALMIYIYK
jgi:hypothetical protein